MGNHESVFPTLRCKINGREGNVGISVKTALGQAGQVQCDNGPKKHCSLAIRL